MSKIKYIVMLGVAACALRTGAMESGEEVDPVGVPAAPARAMADPEGVGVDAAVIDRRLLIDLPQPLMEQVLACLNLEEQAAYGSVCHKAKDSLDKMYRHRVASSLKQPTQLEANARLFSNLIYETLTDEGLALITHKPNLKPEAEASLCRKLAIEGSLILKNNHPLMAAMRHQAGITQLSLVETVAEALTQAGHALSSFDKAVLQHKFAPYTILQQDGAPDFALQNFKPEAFDMLKATYYEVPTQGEIIPDWRQTNLVVSLETLLQAGRKDVLEAHFAGHQDHTLLIDVANDLTELTLGEAQLPQTIKNLAITNSGGQVTAIGKLFLLYCTELKAVNFAALSNVTRIGGSFLSNCTGLTEVDLAELSNVTEIGSGFLDNCKGLTALELSGLSNVTEIGDEFLGGCTGLTTLDLKPLSNVDTIGSFFLKRCTGLTTLDFSALSNVHIIDSWFLSGCTGLTDLDLSSLSNVTDIRSFFLDGCNALQRLIAHKHLEAQLEKFACLHEIIQWVEDVNAGAAAGEAPAPAGGPAS